MFYVYKITNKINNKFYIGKARDVLKRFRTHIKVAKGGKEKYPRKFHAIHGAIAKYGIINFILETIGELNTEKESFDLERKLILEAKEAKQPIYNLGSGGEGNYGWHHTAEAKAKMSIAHKGKKFSEEHKKALSAAQSGEKSFMYGTHLTTKWKENLGKLSAKQVAEIKYLLFNRVRSRLIAHTYKVSEALISMIKHGKIWPEITPLSSLPQQAFPLKEGT